MIVGVTHNSDGRVVQRLSVSTKIAIGLPPNGERNYPTKLDHFVFLSKKKTTKGVEWAPDPELTEHYGKDCREIRIVLIDDDLENIFPTSYAWWTAVERKCWGDGASATRRTAEKPGGQTWAPCGPGCPDLASGQCKPSGDLRFVLADFPRLGSVCRIHTSSYRSIRQIHSALQEIQSFTGGRLAGLTAKLVVRPEEAAYFDAKDNRKKSTTIWALSLEVAGADMKKLLANLTENARVFAETRRLLGGGRVIEVMEDEQGRAPELAAEFYGTSEIAPSSNEKESHAERDGRNNSTSAVNVDGGQMNPHIERACEDRPEGDSIVNKPPSAPPPWEPQGSPARANGEGASLSTPLHAPPAAKVSKPIGTTSSSGAPAQTAAVRGVVGALEPDESGNTVRRNARGVEYVLFKMSQNGSDTAIYCNRPELLPEIARRQQCEATAEVTIVGNNGQRYYVLDRFAGA